MPTRSIFSCSSWVDFVERVIVVAWPFVVQPSRPHSSPSARCADEQNLSVSVRSQTSRPTSSPVRRACFPSACAPLLRKGTAALNKPERTLPIPYPLCIRDPLKTGKPPFPLLNVSPVLSADHLDTLVTPIEITGPIGSQTKFHDNFPRVEMRSFRRCRALYACRWCRTASFSP